jgi:hypothetical protein
MNSLLLSPSVLTFLNTKMAFIMFKWILKEWSFFAGMRGSKPMRMFREIF